MTETVNKYPLDVTVDALVSDLEPNPRNPRYITKERFEALKRSLIEDPHGLRDRPCICLPDGTILAGNMRYRAAADLGWETIPAVFHDFDDNQAKIVALRDNSAYGEWDDSGLTEILYELSLQPVDLELTGLPPDDIRRILDEAAGPDPALDDRGTDLALADVSVGDPKHQVEKHDVWKVGSHLLVCEGVYDGWTAWVKYLNDPTMLLVPYPTPTLPLTVRASEHKLLMVQPDVWLAGHVLDKYAAVRGEDTVRKLDA